MKMTKKRRSYGWTPFFFFSLKLLGNFYNSSNSQIQPFISEVKGIDTYNSVYYQLEMCSLHRIMFSI